MKKGGTVEPEIMAPPKGVVLPFRQVSSMSHKVFLMCMKGVMIEDMTKWVKRRGGSPQRMLQLMRSGTVHGKRWGVNESNGYIRIIYPMNEEA
jgi:hypothetical protein